MGHVSRTLIVVGEQYYHACFGISEVLALITFFDPYNVFVRQGASSYPALQVSRL